MRWFAPLSLALALAACRSDGGIDRADRVPDLEFATSRIARHTRDDVEATRNTIADIPGAIAKSFVDAEREMSATYYLYLENHAAKPKEASPTAGGDPGTYVRQE